MDSKSKDFKFKLSQYPENKVCKIIPNEKDILNEKLKDFRIIIDFYNDIRTKNVLLSAESEFYNDIVSKGELFKTIMKDVVPEEEYRQFLKYYNEVKNMKYLF